MLGRIDALSSALPRKCLYCRWGYPVVFGTEDWLDVLVCGRHAVDGFKTKRMGLRLTERGSLAGGLGYLVAPLVGPWDACAGFMPVGYRPTRKGEFVNARKFELLDRSGLFDEMEAMRDDR